MAHFGGEVQGESGGRDGIIFNPHVVGEGVGDDGCVELARLPGLPKIEKIATFAESSDAALFREAGQGLADRCTEDW